MLLRSKKTHGEEQNWCVILSPLKNEFDKKKVAHKISEIFTLSNEESMDLVSNTPIILLDNLTKNIAGKVKEFFNGIGADTVLTNDVLQKRKCYRTVWPEAPNLSFLQQWQPAGSHPGAEVISTSEAIEAINAIEPPIPITAKSTNLKFSDFQRPERDAAAQQEADRLRKENGMLREQADRAREELNQFKEQARSGRLAETQVFLSDKDKESKELRMLLAHAEEKYQVLHEEYREARSLYEEKISLLMREVDQNKTKQQESVKQAQTSQTEKQALLETISQKETLLTKLREDLEKSTRTYEQKLGIAVQELETFKIRSKEANDKLLFLQRNKEELEGSVNEQADKISTLTEKNRKFAEAQASLTRQLEEQTSVRGIAEGRILELEGILKEETEKAAQLTETHRRLTEAHNILKTQSEARTAALETMEKRAMELEVSVKDQSDKLTQSQEKYRQLNDAHENLRRENELLKTTHAAARETAEKRIAELEISVREQIEKTHSWSEKHRQLTEAHEQLRKQNDEESHGREIAEKQVSEKMARIQEMQQELESRTAEIKRLEMKAAEIDKHFQELQETYQNQDQILQANLRQLEHRERELESARKQLREINFQIEQREAAQRRTRISQEMVEKEAQLKKLVSEQEKMEAEIREREESIRRVLQEQEKIEKDIMEGKQAQRHLAELAKREKPRFKNGKEADDVSAAEQGEA